MVLMEIRCVIEYFLTRTVPLSFLCFLHLCQARISPNIQMNSIPLNVLRG